MDILKYIFRIYYKQYAFISSWYLSYRGTRTAWYMDLNDNLHYIHLWHWFCYPLGKMNSLGIQRYRHKTGYLVWKLNIFYK